VALVGVGYRRQLARWILSNPPDIHSVEITAEHFFDSGDDILRTLSAAYPLYVHGLGLSLGTPGPIDSATLDNFAGVVKIADPEWISDHVAFTRTDEVDLGHLNPIQPSIETLKVIADHAIEISERCNKRLILENITSHLELKGELSEPEFLNRLCEKSGCGLLLDVTNLFINSRNHRFDPRTWLSELDPSNIVQLHVTGYSLINGVWEDFHAEPIQDDLWELIYEALDYAPVQVLALERDTNFPDARELEDELRKLEGAVANHRSDDGSGTPADRRLPT